MRLTGGANLTRIQLARSNENCLTGNRNYAILVPEEEEEEEGLEEEVELAQSW